MKKLTWFKHPKDLLNDKRLSALIDQEGGQGYGTYMYIVETLYMQPDGKLSLRQLNTMKRKGFGKKYMERIIQNYGLFCIEGEEFESVINFGSPLNLEAVSVPNSAGNTPYSAGSVPEPAEMQTDREETPGKNEVKDSADNNLNMNAEERKLSHARVEEEKIRKDKREEEEDNYSWRGLINSLDPNSEWGERVCMKSGFGPLLIKYFKEALEIFKDHVVLYGKEKTLNNQEDARSYFTNYTRAGKPTSKELHNALLALDAQQKAAAPPDAYRYEQRIEGRRTYLGCPIPEDAPPRPNGTTFWNEETHTWG